MTNQDLPGMAEAVEAAAMAVVLPGLNEQTTLNVGKRRAVAAVAAAYPVIAEAVLAEVESRIRVWGTRKWEGMSDHANAWNGGLLSAADLIHCLADELTDGASDV